MDDLLEKAIEIAVKAHRGQKDRYGAPYIMHVLRVMNAGKNTEEKIVGVLHDIIEDTNWTAGNLMSENFPEHIVRAIACISRKEGEAYEAFIDRVATNALAIRVKLNDLADNMDLRRIPELRAEDLERFNRYIAAYHRLNRVFSD